MPREPWWHAPAMVVQVSEEQLRGPMGHPDMCTHWDSQTTCVWVPPALKTWEYLLS